jgi:hypothetical protein
MKNPAARDKTYFIAGRTYDRIFSNHIEPYGTILPLDAREFAELCRTLPKPPPVTELNAIKAFRYLNPFLDKKTLAPPTSIEIRNLMTYGTFNYQRCLSTLPESTYVVARQRLANEALARLKDARCLIVHSRLGNGKSIFLHILAHKLAADGYRCFLCRQNPMLLQRDLEQLKALKKIAIFFDSYNTAIDVIEQLSELLSETKFIVAVRTSVQDVRLHEIQARLPAPLSRMSLNKIDREDIANFQDLLYRSGVQSADLPRLIDRCNDMREVIVSLFDHLEISEKIQNDFVPLLQNRNFKRVFVASQLLKWVGEDVGSAFLRTVTGLDAYAEMAKFREITGDVFSMEDDGLQVRSAIFSQYLIERHLTTPDILDSIYSIVVEAVKRKKERRYQPIVSSLVRVSNLKRALQRDPDHQTSLIGLFERLRRDIDVNREPLFWLQYSFLMTDASDLEAAERFLDTAYERARQNPGFQTYQIDTHALRLLLLIEEQNRANTNVPRFERVIQKLELVLSMVADESHRPYAVKVLAGLEPFVVARLSALSLSERNLLVIQFHRIVDNLDRLSPDARAQSGSDQVKASILRAKERVLAG